MVETFASILNTLESSIKVPPPLSKHVYPVENLAKIIKLAHGINDNKLLKNSVI